MSTSSTDPSPDDSTATDDAEQFWERHYRGQNRVFTGRANPLLVEVAGPLPAGAALDLGCGEGGDALWLASRGWRVTAVDVAATALSRAAERAKAAGLDDLITLARHDLTRSRPDGAYDLVSAQYLHSPVAFDRTEVLRSAAASVTAGGLLLVADHASVPPWSWADPDTRFSTPDELLASLRLPADRWLPEQVRATSRTATGPAGQSATVTDNVVAVRRLTD